MGVITHCSNEERSRTENQPSVHVVAVKPGMIRVGIEAPVSESVGLARVSDPSQVSLSCQDGLNAEVHPGLLRIRTLLQRRLHIAQQGLDEAKTLAATQPERASFLMAQVQEDLGMLQDRIRFEVDKLCPEIPGASRSFDSPTTRS